MQKKLPPILQQLEAYRDATARNAPRVRPLWEVTTALASQMGFTFDELKDAIAAGTVPVAKIGQRGGCYLAGATVERFTRERARA